MPSGPCRASTESLSRPVTPILVIQSSSTRAQSITHLLGKPVAWWFTAQLSFMYGKLGTKRSCSNRAGLHRATQGTWEGAGGEGPSTANPWGEHPTTSPQRQHLSVSNCWGAARVFLIPARGSYCSFSSLATKQFVLPFLLRSSAPQLLSPTCLYKEESRLTWRQDIAVGPGLRGDVTTTYSQD